MRQTSGSSKSQPPTPLWEPRRMPSQQRARATVDAILQAARSVFAERGYAGATTNHIANAAGVSVGSLYQYFPRKEAIAAAMLEDAVFKAGAVLRERMLDCMHTPLEQGIPLIVKAVMELRRANAFFFMGLRREVPGLREGSGNLTIESFMTSTTYAYFQQHREQIRLPDLDVAITMVKYLVAGAVDFYLEDPSPQLDDEQLVAELSNSVLRYLTS
jgi:AcrR family transcriptional regulator